MNDKKDKKVVSMADLTQDETFPQVSEHAINAHLEKEKLAAATDLSHQKLKLDGTPAAKRGRKPKAADGTGNTSKAKFVDPRAAIASEKEKQTQRVESLHAATLVSGTIENLSITLVSKDFKLSQAEREGNIQAWAGTFDYYGGVNLTPPQMLMISHLGIILTRVGTSNETQTKIGLGKAWIKNKIASFKNRKKDALFNNRDDNVGENDIREKESAIATPIK